MKEHEAGPHLFNELEVWKLAIQLVESVYRETRKFPPHERFGLASQMQRAAVSIPANIAEGNARRHRLDYLRHLSIARGSWAELQTHIAIAARLNYLEESASQDLDALAGRVGQMLSRLIQSLLVH